MVFSVEDRILIKVLRKEKGYGAKRLVREFPGKPHTWQLITPVPIVDTYAFLSDLTKRAVAVADVDRFCWNLVTCLQFNFSVLA